MYFYKQTIQTLLFVSSVFLLQVSPLGRKEVAFATGPGVGLKCGSNLFKTKQEFKVQSQQNLERIKRKVGSLSAREAKIVELASRYPPAVVHRTPREKYNQIQESGAIKSPAYACSTAAGSTVAHSGYYSRWEEDLFNSSSCVFASLGPCDGRPRYGEIKLSLHDLEELDKKGDRFIWASHTTGYELAVRQGIRGDALSQAFKQSVVVPDDFEEFMNYFMIDALRSKSCSDREKILSALEKTPEISDVNEGNRHWWTIIDSNRLGYLEVKFDEFVPLDYIKAVEIP